MTPKEEGARQMKLSEQLKSSWDIFDAVEAVKNWRALLLLIGGIVVAFLLLYAGMSTGNTIIICFSVLLAMAIFLYSWNAVGIMLYDNAASGMRTKVSDALLRSLCSGHRLLMLIVISVCGYLVAMLLMALIMLLGRIPGIGTFFTFVTAPVSTIVLGGLWFLCTYLLLPLASVCVWNGDTLGRTLSTTFLLIRHRFMSVLVREVFLVFFSILVGGIIVVCLSMGALTTARVGASLAQRSAVNDISSMEERDFDNVNPMMAPGMYPRRPGMIPGGGFGGDPGGPFGGGMAGIPGMGGMGDGVSQLIAGGSGLLIIFCIASFLPALILAQGLCLIYLSSIKGLDLSRGEAAFRENVANARKRIADARMAAEKAAEEARAKNEQDSAGGDAPAASDVCPRCKFKLADDDVFCPNCGQKRA